MTRKKHNQGAHRGGARPKRSLGQNFLVDHSMVDRIVSAFAPGPTDVALEIGPGRGALTGKLIDKVGKLYALEFDRGLVPLLRDLFAANENFEVIEDDALEFDYARLKQDERPLRLIANLPYNISTAILQRLFDYPGIFADCVLMFQREVADRIMAVPGTKDRGYLTVMTEASFHAEHLFDVPPSAFRPVPKVWSSVIRLSPRADAGSISPKLRKVVAAGFAQKRKTIANNLKPAFPNFHQALEHTEIDPSRRAETLTVDEWLGLTEAIEAFN